MPPHGWYSSAVDLCSATNRAHAGKVAETIPPKSHCVQEASTMQRSARQKSEYPRVRVRVRAEIAAGSKAGFGRVGGRNRRSQAEVKEGCYWQGRGMWLGLLGLVGLCGGPAFPRERKLFLGRETGLG